MSGKKHQTADFPPAFSRRMKALLGQGWDDFLLAHEQAAPVSIRINPLKWQAAFAKELPVEGPVPWCKEGFYLKERPRFSADPLWHAGAYYVQEASSMLISHILQHISLKSAVKALDLGASPGGKSTLLLDHLPKGSLLLANEPIRSRLPALKENLARWGRANALVSQHRPAEIAATGLLFDLILVDAPCSGEGLFRKSPEASREWTPRQAAFCATRQAGILKDILPALAEGGWLLYSTCTYHAEENEARVAQLVESGLEEVEIPMPESRGVLRKTFGYQCYPHEVKGEGFYFALLHKPMTNPARKERIPKARNWIPIARRQREKIEAILPGLSAYALLENKRHGLFALPEELLPQASPILEHLPRCRPLLRPGHLKKELFFPSGISALQSDLQQNRLSYELSREEAESFILGHPLPNRLNKRGLLLLSYRGLGLGWGKGVEGRINVKK